MNTRDASLLETDELVAGYTDVNILHGVSVRVGPGEMVCIIGPNGAGKSTLIKALAGLLPPRGGTVRFNGRDVTGTRPHEIVRMGLGYVPQLDNVFPNMTVEENLELGAFQEPRRVPERLESVYGSLPVLRERRRQRAATLSGGQRQMLALGRALMGGPEMLMLDEPSAGLAPTVVDTIFEIIGQINAGGIGILLVEQNARRALALSHRGYVLDLGRNRFEGSGPDLLHDQKVVDLYLGGAARLQADEIEGEAEPIVEGDGEPTSS